MAKATSFPSHDGLGSRALSRLPFPGAVDFACLVMVGIVIFAVSRAPLGSGDYGQWLMVSDYYQGQDIPANRDPTTIPPLVPALLAVTHLLVPDPMDALTVFRAFMLVLVLGGFYAAGLALFQMRVGALLCAVTGVLVSDRMLELFAFGGLLQIGAIALHLGAVAAFAQGLHGNRHGRLWWNVGSILMGLIVFTHAGSAIVALPAALGVAGLAAFGHARTWEQRWHAAYPVALAMGLVGAYWLIVVLPANHEYASNPASLAYRGPDRLIDDLMAYPPTLIILVAGVAGLGVGVWREARARIIGPFALVGVWAASSWVILAATVAYGASTDYPRFAPMLAAPLAVAAAGLVVLLAEAGQRLLLPRLSVPEQMDIRLIAAAALILVFVPAGLNQFATSANGYRVNQMGDLIATSEWIRANLARDHTVLVSSPREGKWIEGLTGHQALFSNPVRYSFRPDEWERGIDAEAVIRSAYSLTSADYFLKYVDFKEAAAVDVPRQPWVAINHDGEFVDVLRVRPDGVHLLGLNGAPLATMESMFGASVQAREGPDWAEIQTTWTADRAGGPVSLIERSVAGGEARSAVLTYDATGSAGVVALRALLSSAPGLESIRIEFLSGSEAILYFTKIGSREPAVRIRVDGGALTQTSEGIVASALGTRLQIEVTGLTLGKPFAKTGLRFPHQVMEDYGVGAVVLKDDGTLDGRIARMEALGMRTAYTSGPYVVMLREYLLPWPPQPR